MMTEFLFTVSCENLLQLFIHLSNKCEIQHMNSCFTTVGRSWLLVSKFYIFTGGMANRPVGKPGSPLKIVNIFAFVSDNIFVKHVLHDGH